MGGGEERLKLRKEYPLDGFGSFRWGFGTDFGGR